MMKMGIGGSQGRMGRLILSTLLLDSTADCALQIDRSVDLGERLKACNLDVFIDFTEPEAAIRHLELCCQYHLPLVLGVTGFSDAQKSLIAKASTLIPIVFSPNFSLGIHLTFKLLEHAADILKTFREKGIEVDIGIQEMHRKYKKDKPSGTSLRMGTILSTDDYACFRMGDVVGEHSIIFALEGERIEITHRAQDRVVFAKGAVTAAKWLGEVKPKPGLYDMQDVLGH